MSGKHTPGPWRLSAAGPTKTRGFDILAGYQKRVASAPTAHVVYRDDEERMANARLIAAAPDLLEALRKALALSDKHVSDNGRTTECQAVYDMCAAAIAKATGETA